MAIRVDEGVTCAILADRNAAFADRLRHLLSSASDTVFLVGDDPSLMDGARRLRPNLIVVDLGFADDGMVSLLQQIRTEVPAARVIVLSVHDDPAIAQTLVAGGAHGIVLKSQIADELLAAVDTVMAGQSFVSGRFREQRAPPTATPGDGR